MTVRIISMGKRSGEDSSYLADWRQISRDCELIRLGGVSKRLVSCLNCCFGEPRSGGMRRTRDYMCRSFCIKVVVIQGSVVNFLLDSNQCRPASPIFYNLSADVVMEDLHGRNEENITGEVCFTLMSSK